MRRQKNKKKLIIRILAIFIILILYPLNAQNYTEVNVFGWGQALDRGVPAFCDIDNDGYMDMLVGNNDGFIWRLEQTTGDEFVIISHNFLGQNVGAEAAPRFTNIDNDGLIDLVVGSNGDVEWYEQEEINGYTFVLASNKIITEDFYGPCTPALEDLNNDGLLELIMTNGNVLWYFEQDSINAGTFSLIEENWLVFPSGRYGHPFFTNLDGDSLLDLIVGETFGTLYHFIQDSVYATTFHKVSENFAGIDVGESAVPCVIDIDNDHKLDLFIGEWYNGLYHYEQVDSGSADYIPISDQVLGVKDFGYACSFEVYDLDNDGLLDMLVGAYKGADSYIKHYEQNETGSLNFTLQDEKFNDIIIGNYNNLTVFDINGNHLLDLLVSDNSGYVKRYEQESTYSYTFSLVDEQFNNDMKLNQSAHLTFNYIDEDSLLDMIAGEGDGYLYYYEQDSVYAVTFTKQINHFLNLRLIWYSAPQFTNIDGDSLVDLIIGSSQVPLCFYEQLSPQSLDFSKVAQEFGSTFYGNRTITHFADVNKDGNLDMFIMENAGGITLHLRNDDEDIIPPDVPQNLTASIDSNFVNLSWSPCTAEDLYLYNIYRSSLNDTATAEYIYSVDAGITIFSDSTLSVSGKYYYWLTALDLLGNESGYSLPDSVDIEITAIRSSGRCLPENYILYQNFPNPFNPTTTISYQLPVGGEVELSIYNLLGQRIAILVSEKQQSGMYNVQWDATGFTSGVYFYRIKVLGNMKNFVQTKKLVLLK
ncbi:MAG: VCBS repeat-containing protein [Calditrichaceae bacterium]|nr:VCBS repeat-containing protein [Calditrichaceae bacterium]MBN2708588.1 VCBS repeat-containing protein [Calditrichaceae bacterium]